MTTPRASTRCIPLIGTNNTYQAPISTSQRIKSEAPWAKVAGALNPSILTTRAKVSGWKAAAVVAVFAIIGVVL